MKNKRTAATLGVLALLVPTLGGQPSYAAEDENTINQKKRNPVLDFLIGGCMDLFEQGLDCGFGNAAFNTAMCALDIAGFIPGAQWAKLGKLGKIGKAIKVLK